MTGWWKLIAAAWAVLLTVSFGQALVPSVWWFSPGTVHVDDAQFGSCPAMDFDREIERAFYARWVVTIHRQRPDGEFATWATYTGENDYRPENGLPADLDLCWWAGAQLTLPPGTYRVATLWRLMVDGGTREVRRTSNVFTIS